MKLMELQANTRKVVGKGLNTLRREGKTPAHLYGRGVPSQSLEVETPSLEKALKQVGIGHLLALNLDSDKKGVKVLLRDVEKHWESGKPLHVDFYQIRADEKLQIDVPIAIRGEAPAAAGGVGTLLVNMRMFKIECLPEDIPTQIEVDVTGLGEVGQSLHVEDLKLPKGCAVVANPKEMVVKVAPVKVEKVEEKPAAEVPAEGAPAEEGAAPPEGKQAAQPEGKAAIQPEGKGKEAKEGKESKG